MNSLSPQSRLDGQVVHVNLSERWGIWRRLQELGIPACCTEDGQLRVDVSDPITVLQVRSVVQQFHLSRSQLIGWLERCWHE
ncbi:MAG: hypothetical protein NW237_16665 [Cyanobacteriota bacterium]|nr:hypothetical protein [Cyanobacteriota bacterium]